MKKWILVICLFIYILTRVALTHMQTNHPLIPATISDKLLRDSWIYLYQQQDPIHLWDGNTITGRQLAQFIINESIPIVWDEKNICQNISCVFQYCVSGICTFDDGQPGTDPIYIDPSIKTREPGQEIIIARTIAHEIFHRMQYYGQVKVTLYEEFTAYYVSTMITKFTEIKFKGYDPLNLICLKRWFRDHNLTKYLIFDSYPVGMLLTSTPSETEPSCVLEGDMVCTITLEGFAKCETYKQIP